LQKAIDSYKKAVEINPKACRTYALLSEILLLQPQFFDQDLVNQFKRYCAGNTTAMAIFEMLSVFKHIEKTGEEFNKQQQLEFTKKCLKENFKDLNLTEVENWISDNNKSKQALLTTALDFFKAIKKSTSKTPKNK
jgi:hypothetical protein